MERMNEALEKTMRPPHETQKDMAERRRRQVARQQPKSASSR
jgi:hypothetical protein